MNANTKHVALTLGLLILMVVPAGAQNRPSDPTGDDARLEHPRLMIAGSALLVTDNRHPAPEKDGPSTGPELVVAEPLFAFDRVLEGETVEHDFLVANRGAAPLAIQQVRTG